MSQFVTSQGRSTPACAPCCRLTSCLTTEATARSVLDRQHSHDEVQLVLLQEDCTKELRQPVCGVDGQTYPSHCHSEAARVAIDYIDTCHEVPEKSHNR